MTPTDLKAWRVEQGLSQPALAALLGVHEITLSRWERSEREIPPYLHLALEALAAHKDLNTCGADDGATICVLPVGHPIGHKSKSGRVWV